VSVKVATLSRRTGRLALQASASQNFTGRISVQVKARVNGKWQTTARTVAVRRGTVDTTVSIPKRWARTATQLQVTITPPGGTPATPYPVRLPTT
jgi:hypothetical protein